MEILSEALYLAFILAGPMLIISMIVGLFIAVMQAATQIHEQTLTFVPKLVVIAVTLLVMGPWMIESITDFMNRLFTFIAIYV
jgi:flagellar biosynthetic protein FliQ